VTEVAEKKKIQLQFLDEKSGKWLEYFEARDYRTTEEVAERIKELQNLEVNFGWNPREYRIYEF
jgi:hypothetical protein